MFRNLIILITAIALSSFDAIGQNIQWATGVDAQSNNFDKDQWSANGVLGAPNAMPYGELNPNAFRLKNEKTNTQSKTSTMKSNTVDSSLQKEAKNAVNENNKGLAKDGLKLWEEVYKPYKLGK